MNMPIALLGTLMLLAGAAMPARADVRPHEHGAVKVDVAIDGAEMTVAVEMPLDSLVGFERAPRNDAERKAAAEALAKMRAGDALWKPNADAQCTLASAKVEAPVLEPGAKASPGEHADLDATYVWKCAQPGRLATLDVALFDAFKRVKRVEVQVAGPKGQSKTVLRAPAREVRLTK
ncbi:MAG: DUF2796 domain-containing protein [Burkholderiales bacterium]